MKHFIYHFTILDTCVYKGDRFKKHSILDVRTHFKPTETFQYTHFNSCHPPGVRKDFIKGEALKLLRTNSSKAKFEEQSALFKQRLQHRGYPDNLLNMTLSEVKFSQRMLALQNKQKACKRILPFVAENRPSMPDMKHILMIKWHLSLVRHNWEKRLYTTLPANPQHSKRLSNTTSLEYIHDYHTQFNGNLKITIYF